MKGVCHWPVCNARYLLPPKINLVQYNVTLDLQASFLEQKIYFATELKFGQLISKTDNS